MSASKPPERRLGRGLESLLGGGRPDLEPESAEGEGGVKQIGVDAIRPNPMQPRIGFREREMGDLIESVQELGILQPLLVRRAGEGYELIAGERRLRAAKAVGLATVPVIERDTSDDEMLTLALVENLQREDLNPIEKAKGFQQLMDTYGLNQEAAAKRIGKDRATVANFVRLLDLPLSVQSVVSRGILAMGHARALAGLPSESAQHALALRIETDGISVRESEQIVAEFNAGPKRGRRKKRERDPHIVDLEDRIRDRLSTKVKIDYKEGKGRVTVHFYTDDDLQRFLDVVGVTN